MKDKITQKQFNRLVKTSNPYGKALWYAHITWNGYDYNANGVDAEDAIDNLWIQFQLNHRTL